MALCVYNVRGIAQRLLVEGSSLTRYVNSCRDVPALEDDCGLCFELFIVAMVTFRRTLVHGLKWTC